MSDYSNHVLAFYDYASQFSQQEWNQRKSTMPKTIEFNTNRLYTAEGQYIKATLHDDGIVTFYDHSRGVDGEFQLGEYARFDQREIMHRYDHNQYQHSRRSWGDGMMRGGCNTRSDDNAKV